MLYAMCLYKRYGKMWLAPCVVTLRVGPSTDSCSCTAQPTMLTLQAWVTLLHRLSRAYASSA